MIMITNMGQRLILNVVLGLLCIINSTMSDISGTHGKMYYHSSSCMIPPPDKFNFTDMQPAISKYDTHAFSSTTLMGTRDSYDYNIENDLCKSQYASIEQQYEIGVRVFHARIEDRKGNPPDYPIVNKCDYSYGLLTTSVWQLDQLISRSDDAYGTSDEFIKLILEPNIPNFDYNLLHRLMIKMGYTTDSHDTLGFSRRIHTSQEQYITTYTP